ncbi:hypothetical protein TraAM80_00727 [Trypanosoma rangeli]|uniref:Secreted protein n=1 Tax=Trypanosoma rangeli TaxID=5698 RepID=A0A3S5ISK0_TRYRA|nr:uncharacterized protein TraAM80_00727 [Trypanosoma rangeli]RNF11744.1 hypothetical protein TraAM80_00727 [Trypanosoma rangeli]|eukprot:RNF11744.1 hypothetical protein TraAM80_00727 [Trypanosoma rangeli]
MCVAARALLVPAQVCAAASHGSGGGMWVREMRERSGSGQMTGPRDISRYTTNTYCSTTPWMWQKSSSAEAMTPATRAEYRDVARLTVIASASDSSTGHMPRLTHS